MSDPVQEEEKEEETISTEIGNEDVDEFDTSFLEAHSDDEEINVSFEGDGVQLNIDPVVPEVNPSADQKNQSMKNKKPIVVLVGLLIFVFSIIGLATYFIFTFLPQEREIVSGGSDSKAIVTAEANTLIKEPVVVEEDSPYIANLHAEPGDYIDATIPSAGTTLSRTELETLRTELDALKLEFDSIKENVAANSKSSSNLTNLYSQFNPTELSRLPSEVTRLETNLRTLAAQSQQNSSFVTEQKSKITYSMPFRLLSVNSFGNIYTAVLIHNTKQFSMRLGENKDGWILKQVLSKESITLCRSDVDVCKTVKKIGA